MLYEKNGCNLHVNTCKSVLQLYCELWNGKIFIYLFHIHVYILTLKIFLSTRVVSRWIKHFNSSRLGWNFATKEFFDPINILRMTKNPQRPYFSGYTSEKCYFEKKWRNFWRHKTDPHNDLIVVLSWSSLTYGHAYTEFVRDCMVIRCS